MQPTTDTAHSQTGLDTKRQVSAPTPRAFQYRPTPVERRDREAKLWAAALIAFASSRWRQAPSRNSLPIFRHPATSPKLTPDEEADTRAPTNEPTYTARETRASSVIHVLAGLRAILVATRRLFDREGRIVARYQGRRWCDATERSLTDDLADYRISRRPDWRHLARRDRRSA